MKIHFVEDGRHPRLRRFHVRQRAALVGRERISAGELDQEQIVLHEIGSERRLRQRASAHLADEVVVDVALPVVCCGCFQPVEDVHRSTLTFAGSP